MAPLTDLAQELADDERALLGDLLAVIEEHSVEGSRQIDRRGGRARLRLRLRAPRRPAPAHRRGLHHPPGRGGEDLRRPAPRHRDPVRGAAARHGRGHERQPGAGRGAVRRVDRPARRRGHEAHRDHLPEPRREPGRELPQDDGRDGHGPPGHPDQARRPPPQHAHPRRACRSRSRSRRRARRSRSTRRSPTGSGSTRSSGSSRTSRSSACTRASTTRSRSSSPSSAPSASATSPTRAGSCGAS